MPASFAPAGTFSYNVLLSDGHDVTSRAGTLAAGIGLMQRGQIVNMDPVTGAVSVAVLGTTAPNAIVADDADSTAGAVPILVYLTGKFKTDAVIWPPTGAKGTIADSLRDYGIYLESVLYSSGAFVMPHEQQPGDLTPVATDGKPSDAPLPDGRPGDGRIPEEGDAKFEAKSEMPKGRVERPLAERPLHEKPLGEKPLGERPLHEGHDPHKPKSK
jgi:hypothetical protein